MVIDGSNVGDTEGNSVGTVDGLFVGLFVV